MPFPSIVLAPFAIVAGATFAQGLVILFQVPVPGAGIGEITTLLEAGKTFTMSGALLAMVWVLWKTQQLKDKQFQDMQQLKDKQYLDMIQVKDDRYIALVTGLVKEMGEIKIILREMKRLHEEERDDG